MSYNILIISSISYDLRQLSIRPISVVFRRVHVSELSQNTASLHKFIFPDIDLNRQGISRGFIATR